VTGQVLSAAVISIMRAHCGLQKATSTYSRKVATGRIVSQVPKAGAVLAAGGLVTIVYSKGPRANAPPTRCVVPKLKRMSLIAAVMRVTRAGCTAKLKQAYSKKIPLGRVVSQAPRAGKILALRGTVTVVTSKGPRPR
jgi:beta-lactam-binding protein with PASTA domain